MIQAPAILDPPGFSNNSNFSARVQSRMTNGFPLAQAPDLVKLARYRGHPVNRQRIQATAKSLQGA
jgi:hypothetical protein